MSLTRLLIVSLILAAAAAAAMIPLGRERRAGGTFIGAIVAEDGLVVGSDSRSTFLDTDGHSLGYVDGMQKVYVSNTTAVAVSGLTSVDGELFSTFVDRNSFLLQRTPDEVLFGFSAWLPFKNSTGVLLLSAGFIQGKPSVCVRSVVQPQACRTSGFITNKPSASLSTWLNAQRTAPNAAAAAEALKLAIQESAASDATVGGPISIVQLRAGEAPLWLENAPRAIGWKTICDLIRDYRSGRIQISPTSSRRDLDRYLSSSCPK